MKLKKLISVICVLALTFTLGACGNKNSKMDDKSGNSSKKSEKIVIGASMPDFEDKWQTYLIDSIKKYDEQHEDVEVIFSDAKNDSSKQISQVENFITQSVDAILLIVVDPQSAAPIVKIANDADTPIIAVNRYFNEVDKATAYVGSESIQAGEIQMEEVSKRLKNKGNIAIMKGVLGYEPQVKRTEGNMNIINKYDDIKLVTEGVGKWERAQAMQVVENWLQAGKKIDAIVCNNDEMAIGALKAVKAEGKLNQIIVAGVDATPDALEYIKSGELSVSVYQDARGQGNKAIETAIKAARGEKVDKLNYIPFQLVTKENVEEYIAKWK